VAARGFGEFRDGLRLLACPGQNVVYADVDGTIAYQCTGLYPVRRSGDGTVPVPGWTDENEWDGYVPFEELPWSVDPADGFLATANQRIHDDSYPHLIGRDFLPPFRARRIAELATRTALHTRETFAVMQSDTVSLSARAMLPLLLGVDPEGDRQKEALGYLADWDGDLDRDSVAAAVYEAWVKHIARAVLLPRLGPELFSHYWGRGGSTTTFQHLTLPNLLAYPTATWFGADGVAARDDVLREALDASIAELTEHLGEDMASWRWGALHRVVFAGPLARIPGLADLFTGGAAEVGGDGQTICQSAFEPEIGYRVAVLPSWRQVVDLADVDASVGVHTTGQSGNPASPHWNDQMPLWAEGRHHPLPFTRPAVDAQAEAVLRLLPG
jgi:penicillin G amidase